MKNKINSAILALPLVVAGTALAHAEERRTYELNGFEMVEAHNGIDVAIQQGDTFSIVAKSNKASHLDDLKITQNGDRLIIKQDTDMNVFSLLSLADNWNRSVHVTIQMPALSEVKSKSGADVRVDGFQSGMITFSASSGADLIAKDIDAGKIHLEASGGANLTAEGTCATLNAEASSGADIWASSLECSKAHIEASSGADIDAKVTDHLTAEASSGGTVNVDGTPNYTNIEERSGGDVVIAR